MNIFMYEGAWLCSETAMIGLIEQMEKFSGVDLNQLYDPYDDDEDDGHPLLEVHDSVGVISVRGTLTNRQSPWNRFFGITAYGDIRDALAVAVNDDSVKKILLDIDSHGGQAVGVSELGSLIRTIDKDVKPVFSYSGGAMNSAAYWIGSQARKIYAADMAELGSIGVIMVHKEFTEAFKQQGIKVNVIRTGKFKALVNPYEKLSEVARKQVEERQMTFYNLFLAAVAKGRRKDVSEVSSRMAEGRTFLGPEAVKVGLADSVGFFDQIVARLQASESYRGNAAYA